MSSPRIALPAIAAAIAALSLAAGSTQAATAKAPAAKAPVAAVHAFIDAFNKGDIKTAEAANLADVAIVDEPAPHYWHGPGAFMAWAGDLDKMGKAAGDTDQKVTLGRLIRQQVDGDSAYVVMAATFTYTEKGVPMAEPARIAAALKKTDAGWKIASWTWAGDVPKPVAKAKP